MVSPAGDGGAVGVSTATTVLLMLLKSECRCIALDRGVLEPDRAAVAIGGGVQLGPMDREAVVHDDIAAPADARHFCSVVGRAPVSKRPRETDHADSMQSQPTMGTRHETQACTHTHAQTIMADNALC